MKKAIQNWLWKRSRRFRIRMMKRIVEEVSEERRLERKREHDKWLASAIYKTRNLEMVATRPDTEPISEKKPIGVS